MSTDWHDLPLAERIVDSLLDPKRDDIYEATHGNYQAELISIRLRQQWVAIVQSLLDDERP